MSLQDLPKDLRISEEDWKQTPPAVRVLILHQRECTRDLSKLV